MFVEFGKCEQCNGDLRLRKVKSTSTGDTKRYDAYCDKCQIGYPLTLSGWWSRNGNRLITAIGMLIFLFIAYVAMVAIGDIYRHIR